MPEARLRSSAAWRRARLTAGRWSARLRGGGLRVLLYHHFPESCGAALEAQCALLRRRCAPIPLAEAVACLERRMRLPENAVAVTIDDGYADYARMAHPCFAGYGIPTTVFVAEQLIDGGWLWFDRVAHAVHSAAHNMLHLPAGPWGGAAQFPLGAAEEERAAAANILMRQAKQLPHAALDPFVAALEKALATRRPEQPPGAFAGMCWKQLRRLAETGSVTIGAHTATHPILARVEDAAVLCNEVRGCRERMEQRLGRPVEFFAYPNGQPADINARVVAAVREAGYRAACTTLPGVNRPGESLLHIKRLSIRPEMPAAALADLLTAAR